MAAKKSTQLPSFTDLLQLGFDVVREHRQLFLKLLFIGYAPLLFISTYMQYLMLQGGVVPGQANQETAEAMGRWMQSGGYQSIMMLNLVNMVAVFWFLYLSMVITYAAGLHFQDKKKLLTSTMAELIKFPITKFWAMVATNIMAGFALMFLFLLLVVPGFIFSIYWMFLPEIVLFTNLSGTDAMSRSKALVTGRWWQMFRYTIGMGLVALIFMVLIQWGTVSITTLLPGSVTYLVNVVGFVTQFALIGLTATRVALYFKLDEIGPKNG